jgi:uncharacterized protein (TIGR03067 family)
MKAKLLAVLVVGLLLAADDSKEDAAKKDLKKMQGAWVMASSEREGKKLSDEEMKKYSRTVEGDKITVSFEDENAVRLFVYTLRLDPTKKPKAIDVTFSEGPQKGKTMHGIYEFDGDNCKVGFAPLDKERPTEFVSKEGTGHVITVWKPAKK